MLTPWKFLSASHNKIMDRLIHTVFAHLLIFYLILFILENLFTGFVSNNFDLNILLIPIFAAGMLSAFFPAPKQKKKKATKLDYLTITLLTVLTFIIILTKTSTLGEISIVLSSVSSLLVLFVSLMILFEK